MIDEETFNLSDAITKRKLMAAISPLQGIHEVTIKPLKMTRRQRANRYYFGCVVGPFQKFLAAQGQAVDRQMCHDHLKLRCNPVEVFDPRTGELLSTVPGETKNLSIPVFAQYVDRCIHYLFDMFVIVCESPDDYFAADPPKGARAA